MDCSARKNATPAETEQTLSRFSQSEPQLSNSFRSFDYARDNESIIYFTDLCKPIETYIYAKKKLPICKLSHLRELYILTRTETRQLFLRMVVTLLKGCFILFKRE